MRRTRSSHDVSLLYLSMLAGGFVVWLAYGLSICNWAMIISNTASLMFMTITIVVALSYRRAGARAGRGRRGGAHTGTRGGRARDDPDARGRAGGVGERPLVFRVAVASSSRHCCDVLTRGSPSVPTGAQRRRLER